MNKEKQISKEYFEKMIVRDIEGLKRYKERLSENEMLADDIQTFLFKIQNEILKNESFVPLSMEELIKLLILLSDSEIEKSDNIYNRNLILIKYMKPSDGDAYDFIINLFHRKIIREIKTIKENVYKIIFCPTLHVSDYEQYVTNEKLKREKITLVTDKKN